MCVCASLGVLSRLSAMVLFFAGSSELNCSHKSPSTTHCREGGREGGREGWREGGREGGREGDSILKDGGCIYMHVGGALSQTVPQVC